LALSIFIDLFKGGDQGLLNSYFANWSKGDSSRRIPFGYNLTINAAYSYLPAFKHFQNEVKVVHFIGYNKPWTFHRFADGKIIPHGQQSQDYLKFVQMWWNLYDESRNKRPGHSLGLDISNDHFQTFKHVTLFIFLLFMRF
jgi:lipopolysaccharide biosynthesis glycosyltransferase